MLIEYLLVERNCPRLREQFEHLSIIIHYLYSPKFDLQGKVSWGSPRPELILLQENYTEAARQDELRVSPPKTGDLEIS